MTRAIYRVQVDICSGNCWLVVGIKQLRLPKLDKFTISWRNQVFLRITESYRFNTSPITSSPHLHYNLCYCNSVYTLKVEVEFDLLSFRGIQSSVGNSTSHVHTSSGTYTRKGFRGSGMPRLIYCHKYVTQRLFGISVTIILRSSRRLFFFQFPLSENRPPL